MLNRIINFKPIKVIKFFIGLIVSLGRGILSMLNRIINFKPIKVIKFFKGLIVSFGICYLLYILMMWIAFQGDKWTDEWIEYNRYITDDNKYSVIVYASYTALTPAGTFDVKVECQDNTTGKTVVLKEKKCSFSDDDFMFEFKCISQNEAYLIINDCISPIKITIFWDEYF